MGIPYCIRGTSAEARAHFDQAFALYDPVEHGPLATRFGQDVAVATLSYRSLALWMLGYPEAALADAESALKDARETVTPPTLMFALHHGIVHSNSLWKLREQQTCKLMKTIALADEKGALSWKAVGGLNQGCVLALTGKASEAIQMITFGDQLISIKQDQQFGCHCYLIVPLRMPMRKSAKSTRLGVALAKQ